MEDSSFKPQLEAMKKKAEAGDSKAAYQLAMTYIKGDGVKPDVEEAAKWASMAFDGLTEDEKDELPYH